MDSHWSNLQISDLVSDKLFSRNDGFWVWLFGVKHEMKHADICESIEMLRYANSGKRGGEQSDRDNDVAWYSIETLVKSLTHYLMAKLRCVIAYLVIKIKYLCFLKHNFQLLAWEWKETYLIKQVLFKPKMNP